MGRIAPRTELRPSQGWCRGPTHARRKIGSSSVLTSLIIPDPCAASSCKSSTSLTGRSRALGSSNDGTQNCSRFSCSLRTASLARPVDRRTTRIPQLASAIRSLSATGTEIRRLLPPETFQQFERWLQLKVAKATRRSTIGKLRTIWRATHSDGLVPSKPPAISQAKFGVPRALADGYKPRARKITRNRI